MTPPNSQLSNDAQVFLAVLEERFSNFEKTITKQIDQLKQNLEGCVESMKSDIETIKKDVHENQTNIKTMKKDVDANTELRKTVYQLSIKSNVQLVITIGLLVAVIVKMFV